MLPGRRQVRPSDIAATRGLPHQKKAVPQPDTPGRVFDASRPKISSLAGSWRPGGGDAMTELFNDRDFSNREFQLRGYSITPAQAAKHKKSGLFPATSGGEQAHTKKPRKENELES